MKEKSLSWLKNVQSKNKSEYKINLKYVLKVST